MINRQDIALFLLDEKVKNAKVGILARGLKGIDPLQLVRDFASKSEKHIFAAIVGYGVDEEESPDCSVSPLIEKAVFWRSIPEYAGSIIVIVKDDADKLHSLAEFDSFTMRDFSNYLLKKSLSASLNDPTRSFWDALITDSSFYSVDALENFIDDVLSMEADPLAISKSMWRLNLLRDDEILNSKSKPLDRMRENRKLIASIGQLSAEATKRLSRNLATIKGKDKEHLQTAYKNLQDYIRYGRNTSIQKLDYATVKQLIQASQKASKTDTSGNETPPVRTNDSMSAKDVTRTISDLLFSDEPEDKEVLDDLLEKIRAHFASPDDDGTFITDVSGPFEGKRVECAKNDSPLRKIVGKVCNDNNWGAVVTTEASTLKDAISNYIECECFIPSADKDAFTSFDGMSLFDFICGFDDLFKKEGYSSAIPFTPIIEKLKGLRHELIDNIDVLMHYAILALKQDSHLCESLFSYVKAWQELYHAYRVNYNALSALSPVGSKFIAKEILVLDTLFIRTPKEWKAVLLPLHPIYLWRYSEVFKCWNDESATLSKEDSDALKNALFRLPQVLNVVVASDIVSHDGHNYILPCSGNIEMLPTFENKTNRYIGEDGIESVEEILNRWLGFAPFTINEIRICTVDIPGITDVIRSVKSFIDKSGCKRVVIDAYMTRNQNSNDELSRLDFAGKDHDISLDMKNGVISLGLHHVEGPAEVKKSLNRKPVHIAFFFDQSSYSVEYAPSHKSLYITPLVVTYDYHVDKRTHRGTIAPSSDTGSGLIGDYHRVMESADVIISDMNIRTTYNDTPEVNDIVSTIEDGVVQWLVVADRSTSYYMPANAIPIGEKQYDRRTVSTWVSAESRIVSDYISELCKYNLYPQKETIADILRCFGHIASCGLISIPKYSSDSKAIENMKKGLLGTLFAAVKYTKDFSNQNPLIASLDTSSAKNWLYDSRFGNERADLIGMRYDESNNTLYVQPIEVKTRDESPDATPERDEKNNVTYLVGHAADQIAAVSNLLREIFGLVPADSHKMFISARREVLKYQIVSECFRKTHAPESQELWEQVFRRAFGNGERGNIKVVVSGILYHFKLSDTSMGQELVCFHKEDECEITLHTMTTPMIQSQIFGEDTEPLQVIDSNISAMDGINETDMSESASWMIIEPESVPIANPVVKHDIKKDSEPARCVAEKKIEFEHTACARFLLGQDNKTGEKYYWEFGDRNLNNRHLLINGNSGCGKTYCIQALLMEASMQGISSVVFDYTGGFTNSKLDKVFKEKLTGKLTQRVIKINKIPINPFKKNETQIDEDLFIPESNVDIATKIAEIFTTVYSLGDQQKSAVYTAVNNGLSSYGDAMNFRILANALEDLGTNYAKSVLSKIQAFIDLDPFDTAETFDWSTIRDSNGVVYVMQLSGYTRDVQLLLTELMLWDIWNFCVKTGDESKPFIVVLDEAQNLNHGENSPSAKILTEGRKFGISGWYATQFMKPQLTDDEIQRLQQAGQKLYFCPPDDGITTVAKNIDINPQGAKEWAGKLKKLKKGEAVTCGNMMRNAKWVRYDPHVIKITCLEDRI